jgi:hypothetical protein
MPDLIRHPSSIKRRWIAGQARNDNEGRRYHPGEGRGRNDNEGRRYHPGAGRGRNDRKILSGRAQ